jgi:predicted transcriptional regulator
MMEHNPTQVSAYLDANVLAMLKKMAAEEDRSISWLVGYAVKQLIVERVKAQDAKAGAQRQVQLEDVIAAKSPAGKPAKHK